MQEPLSNKPKITKTDVARGYVVRYFVRMISTGKVTEVDKIQYDNFQTIPFYQTLKLNWIIGGNDEDVVAVDGKVIYGTKNQNTILIEHYNKEMPGIDKVLRDSLEFFTGKQIDYRL
jgi:hypothetical protein